MKRIMNDSFQFCCEQSCVMRVSTAAVKAARASCASYPGTAESMQLNASGRLGISCEPPENDGISAPCIHEHFFNLPKGFEVMGPSTFAFHSAVRRIDPFNQCRRRLRDEDWPTLELYLERTSETKRMADVMSLLRGRTVTLVGASVVRAMFGAFQCALEGAGLRRQHELEWKRWGWSGFTVDNNGCATTVLNRLREEFGRSPKDLKRGKRFVDGLRREGCAPAGRGFASLLDNTDVVIIGCSRVPVCPCPAFAHA